MLNICMPECQTDHATKTGHETGHPMVAQRGRPQQPNSKAARSLPLPPPKKRRGCPPFPGGCRCLVAPPATGSRWIRSRRAQRQSTTPSCHRRRPLNTSPSSTCQRRRAPSSAVVSLRRLSRSAPAFWLWCCLRLQTLEPQVRLPAFAATTPAASFEAHGCLYSSFRTCLALVLAT
jgi:hypothetical protein